MEGIKAVIFDWVGTLYRRNEGKFLFSEEILDYLLPKYKLGLVSKAAGGIRARYKQIEDSGLREYFSSIVVKKWKDPEDFLQCARELGVSPQQCVVVDDIAIRGIRAANKIGMTTFWIQKGDRSHLKPEVELDKADYIIDSAEELKEYL